MVTITSPCNKICTVDPGSGICIGCGRTLDEIGRWLSLTENDRARVMAELPRRLTVVRATRSANSELA